MHQNKSSGFWSQLYLIEKYRGTHVPLPCHSTLTTAISYVPKLCRLKFTDQCHSKLERNKERISTLKDRSSEYKIKR